LRASLLAGDVRIKLGRRSEAIEIWRESLKSDEAQAMGGDPLELATRYALLRRLGQQAPARAIEQTLDRLGYRHPFYVREKHLKI
jgi:hypothetical protein